MHHHLMYVLITTALLALAGCGRSGISLDNARQAVENSLSQWKAGGKSADLQIQNKLIEIADDDWYKGHQLSDFEIKDVKHHANQNPRVIVLLHLKERSGKAVKREVVYEVEEKEKIIIGRDVYY